MLSGIYFAPEANQESLTKHRQAFIGLIELDELVVKTIEPKEEGYHLYLFASTVVGSFMTTVSKGAG